MTLDFPWTAVSKVAVSRIVSLTVAAVQTNVCLDNSLNQHAAILTLRNRVIVCVRE